MVAGWAVLAVLALGLDQSALGADTDKSFPTFSSFFGGKPPRGPPSAKEQAETRRYLDDLGHLRRNLQRKNQRREGQNGPGTNNWARFHRKDGVDGAGFDPNNPTGDGRLGGVLRNTPEAIQKPVQPGLAWTWKMYAMGEREEKPVKRKLADFLDGLVRRGKYSKTRRDDPRRGETFDSETYSKSRGEFWRIYLKDLSDQDAIDANTKGDGMVNAGWAQFDGRGAMDTLYMVQNKVLDDRLEPDRIARDEIRRKQAREVSGAGSTLRRQEARSANRQVEVDSAAEHTETENGYVTWEDEQGNSRYGYYDEDGRFHDTYWGGENGNTWVDTVWSENEQEWQLVEETEYDGPHE